MELKLFATPTATTIQVADAVFAREFKPALIHQVVTAYRAGGRLGNRAQKSRSMVRGGGAKPWRQKGLGRARVGTIRSPLWRGGGVTFAAKPQDFTQKVNKKMYRNAICSILSELVRQERLLLVDDFTVPSNKTRDLVKKLQELKLDKVLLIIVEFMPDLYLAARNLKDVHMCDVASVNPVNLIVHEKVLLTVPALKKLEARCA